MIRPSGHSLSRRAEIELRYAADSVIRWRTIIRKTRISARMQRAWRRPRRRRRTRPGLLTLIWPIEPVHRCAWARMSENWDIFGKICPVVVKKLKQETRASTSMPRYLTVLSILVCPNSSCTARKLPVRR